MLVKVLLQEKSTMEIANRLAPQVQIVFLGISLKFWVGLAMLTAAWALIIKVMGQEAIAWIKSLNILIKQIGYYYSSTL